MLGTARNVGEFMVLVAELDLLALALEEGVLVVDHVLDQLDLADRLLLALDLLGLVHCVLDLVCRNA